MIFTVVTSDTRPEANHTGPCNRGMPVTGCLRCGFVFNDPTPCDVEVHNHDGSEKAPPRFAPPRERGRWWERR